MKDLYKRNRLVATTGAARIRERLAKLERDKPDVRAAKFILLNEQRRRVYDRQHALLQQIGHIRKATGLLAAGHWERSHFDDFAPAAVRNAPRTGEVVTPAGRRSGGAWRRSAFWIAMVIGLPGFIAYLQDTSTPQRTPSAPSTAYLAPTATRPNTPQFALPAVTLPANGDTVMRTAAPESFEIPFEVHTDGNRHNLVKMVDVHNTSRHVTFFLRAGRNATVNMPQGTWELRYASGRTWYGLRDKFGPQTYYAKADNPFPIQLDADNGYQVWTVELILQSNGNLRTRSIGAAGF